MPFIWLPSMYSSIVNGAVSTSTAAAAATTTAATTATTTMKAAVKTQFHDHPSQCME